VLHNFEKGQWSIALAALLAAGFRALDEGRARRAGALFGVAAALKVTPLVLLGLLVLRHRRAAAAMAATFGAILLVTLAVGGVAPWRAFFGGAARNAAVWAPWIANTASPAGIYARLFDGGAFARPLVAAPALATAAFDATAIALLAAALLAHRRASASSQPPPVVAAGGRASALEASWLTFPVLLNPLGWSHVLVMLLAPAVIAARDGGRTARALALAALAAFSVPRQTLALLAGPVPCSPGRGLALGVHAAFAVVLFATLLGVSRDRGGGRRA
jgi:alpha-1,2-mannosyltransferase